MNNRIESAKTYLGILENYRKDHGYYPYFDQNFIRLLLTKYPDMINSIEMKKFIMENLFYYVESKIGELKDSGVDVINLDVINFGPKDLKDQLILFDRLCERLMSPNPVNIQTYGCYVSLIPLDFNNGSEFSKLFFTNLKIFSQVDLETKLSRLIYLKFNNVYNFHLLHTILFWIYNILFYYFMGFDPSNNILATVLYCIGGLFNIEHIKFMMSEGRTHFTRFGQISISVMHLFVLLVTIMVHNRHSQISPVMHISRMLAVVSLSIRGIWLMRIFKPSRFLVCMIYQVIKRIMSFFVMMFYTIFIFESIWRTLPSIQSGSMEDDNTFTDSMISTFSIAFMSYDTSTYELKEWIVFVLGMLVLNFIMLNYLVSIICIFYEEVAESKLMTDIDEVIKMINEADFILSGIPHFKIKYLINSTYIRIRRCKNKPKKEKELKKAWELYDAQINSPGVHYISLISTSEAPLTSFSPVVTPNQNLNASDVSIPDIQEISQREQLLDRISNITDNRVGSQTQEIITFVELQNKKLRLEMDAKLTIFMHQIADKMDHLLHEIKAKDKELNDYRELANTSRGNYKILPTEE